VAAKKSTTKKQALTKPLKNKDPVAY